MEFDELYKNEAKEVLAEMRTWLFQENIRLKNWAGELEQERQELHKETSSIKRKQELERKRIKEENRFFDKKLRILQDGFAALESDRKAFQKEVELFQAKKCMHEDPFSCSNKNDVAGILFRGVNSYMALKKRYKDLMKMYHPDNIAGDQEMVQIINREYAEIKKAYEMGRQA